MNVDDDDGIVASATAFAIEALGGHAAAFMLLADAAGCLVARPCTRRDQNSGLAQS